MKRVYIRDLTVRKRLFWFKEADRLGVNRACLKLGIHKSQFYYWKRRFLHSGLQGLYNQSTRPKHSPKISKADLVQRVLALRNETRQGADTIAILLRKRFGLKICRSTIHKILKRERKVFLRPKASKKKHIRRYQANAPGDRVQIDVKYVPYRIQEGLYGRVYQYTAIDDCTRVRFAQIYSGHGICYLKDFLESLLNYFPFKIKLIQTDNHVIFTYKYTSHKMAFKNKPKEHFLEIFCRQHNIKHHLIEPGEPELNGKVERSHRTDGLSFYEHHSFRNLKPLQDRFNQWIDYYNHIRPHWGIKGMTPIEKLNSFNYQIERISYEKEITYSLAA